MSGSPASAGTGRADGPSLWTLGLIPVVLLAAAIGLLALLDGPGLGDRNGPPAEELIVEQTILEPGSIELQLRNDGPDAVSVEQVSVNDAYIPFEGGGEIGRLAGGSVTIPYPWIEGEAYELFLLLSTGGTIEAAVDVAVETPDTDLGFFGLMALLGIYVGVIPVSIGMLWLPFVRRVGSTVMQALMAFTVGLLAFLAVDAALEGLEFAEAGSQAFGGASLVFLGAAAAYLILTAISAHMSDRRARAEGRGAGGYYLALLIAIGIGLHNLGEGLAIGTAYAGGALALGAFLVIGFALHNTTEGLAIVAPLAEDERPSLVRLGALGLVAGGPAVLGAWIGAAAFNTSVAALLFGAGVGAIAQVVVQLTPAMRDGAGRALHTVSVAGILAGFAVMYLTGLLISV